MIELKTIRRPDIAAAPYVHDVNVDVGIGRAVLIVRASFDFSASAVVASRVPLVLLRDLPELSAVASEPNTAVSASQAVLVQYLFGAPWDVGGLTTLRTNELPRLPKVEPFRVEVSVTNGQVGDVMSDFVLQYLDGPSEDIFALVR